MVKTVIWSQEALDDIDGIAAFIAKDSVYYAQQVVQQLFEISDSIIANPELGRKVPEFGKRQIRERFLYSYRVIYEVTHESIFILAVIHGRRLLESDSRFED